MTIGVTAQPTTPRGVASDEVLERLRQAGVPPRFEDCRLTTFRKRPGVAKAIEAAELLAADGDGRGLLLSGPPGTGKTHLAVGVLAARLERWLAEYPRAWWEVEVDDTPNVPPRVEIARRPALAVQFLVVPSFLDRLRAAARFPQSDDPLPDLFDVDLLVLDDLGREKVTDWATERLYVLVNERYNRRRPTLVTTNYPAGELVERGYDALVSRLMEGADLIRIEAPDFRVQGGR